jgi:hypothetical protein
MSRKALANPTRLPQANGEDGVFHVVIETEKGSWPAWTSGWEILSPTTIFVLLRTRFSRALLSISVGRPPLLRQELIYEN